MALQLCVNYKSSQANWATDMAYFRSVGITAIRPHLPAVGYPWSNGLPTSPGNFAWWRMMAQTWSAAGFTVVWGISGYNGFNTTGLLTAARWTEYATIILAEAAYLQAQGISIIFEIGNEMESMADGSTLTVDQLQLNLGALATSVKAVYTIGKVSYSPWDFAGTTYSKWVTNGKGGLDFINVHPYCNMVTGGRSMTVGAFSQVAQMAKAFPGAVMCTEFGMEGGDANLQAMPAYLKKAKIQEMWNSIANLGITMAFVYSWCGYLNGDNQFAMKLMDGTFDPQWYSYLSRGGTYNRDQ